MKVAFFHRSSHAPAASCGNRTVSTVPGLCDSEIWHFLAARRAFVTCFRRVTIDLAGICKGKRYHFERRKSTSDAFTSGSLGAHQKGLLASCLGDDHTENMSDAFTRSSNNGLWFRLGEDHAKACVMLSLPGLAAQRVGTVLFLRFCRTAAPKKGTVLTGQHLQRKSFNRRYCIIS